VAGGLAAGLEIGRPCVSGASVTAEVLEPLVKGDKIVIWKHRAKKTFRKKQGDRQPYTAIKITGING